MTRYDNTVGKGRPRPDMQTGFGGLFSKGINSELLSLDTRIQPQEELRIKLALEHDLEYIGTNDPNYRSPKRADSINLMGAGLGAAGTAAGLAQAATYGGTIGSVVPGVGTVAGAAVVAGGAIIVSSLSGIAEQITGGLGFNVTAYYREKGKNEWVKMSQGSFSVPASGIGTKARKVVEFKATNGPFKEGKYEIKVDVNLPDGTDVDTYTRMVNVDSRAKQNKEGDNGGGFNFTEWAIKNPVKAAGAGIVGLTIAREATSSAITGE